MDLALPGTAIFDFNQLAPEHAELLDGADRVLFLDAYPAGPGHGPQLLALADPAAIALPRSCFGHAVQPTEIVALAAALYGARPEAWLAAIPGFDFDLGEGLSAGTEQGVREIVRRISALLQSNPQPGGRHACVCDEGTG